MHHTYTSPFIHTAGYPAKSQMRKHRAARWKVPRPVSFRPLRLRIAGVAFFVWVLYQQHLFSVYSNALASKYAPTEFDLRDANWTYRPDDEALNLQAELLASISKWKKLGAGFEGTTYLFNDTVIKTFASGRSPFRNCALGDTGARWPTEIPASLLFCSGGGGHNTTSLAFPNASTIRCPQVKTAFYTSASPEAVPQWRLATSFARQGTLGTLSRTIHPQRLGFRTLDARYRRTFRSLLRSLHTLHAAGFCHDDIKPDNIFIGDDSEWMVGDLGNVRHVGHAYHRSRIWADNGQLLDCRANDAVRALKSYILFLRAVSEDAEVLDEELLSGRGPLSRLFLGVLAGARTMTADELRRQSGMQHAPRIAESERVSGETRPSALFSVIPKLLFRRQRMARKVRNALHLSNSETYARWKALTWVFDIELGACGCV